ncbi:cytochrome P450 [Winogradskyella sp.]|uniref:cytochrome P450 n=1 Tax=Winogradskyella sp. TaxID=1883156 RepID=UPI003AB6B561
MTYTKIDNIDIAKEILRSNSFGTVNLKDHLYKLQEASKIDFSTLIFFCEESFVFQSGESHLESRRYLSTFFNKKNAELWRKTIQTQIRFVFEKIPFEEEVDLLLYFTDPIYLLSVKNIIGVDFDNDIDFLSLVNTAKNFTEPILSLKKNQKLQESISSINNLVKKSLKKNQKKSNSLIEVLDNHKEMSLEQKSVLITSVIIAAHTMSETLLIIIYKLSKTEGDLWGDVKNIQWIEERIDGFLRLFPTTQRIVRKTLKTTSIMDVTFKAGTIIQIQVPIANRDHRFTPEKEILKGKIEASCPINHVSFGGGKHLCPGVALSKLVLSEAISFLASNSKVMFSSVKPIIWTESFMIKKPTQMKCILKGTNSQKDVLE